MGKQITSSNFGSLPSGHSVTRHAMQNANDIALEVLNYGGIIKKLLLPNREGILENCVLGYANLEDYVVNPPYLGALVGRCANRIAAGKLVFDDQAFPLAQNLGKHHLHGGNKGFDKVIWRVEEKIEATAVVLTLTYTSPHLEEGYPGNLELTVSYRLTDTNLLLVDYKAKTDRKTVVNLTQHSYFNLSGSLHQQVGDHQLRIPAEKILAVNDELIPTGDFLSVAATPFDFRQPKPIGQELFSDHRLMQMGQGYDHCYCFDTEEQSLKPAAVLIHPQSGRKMEVSTTAPAMQLYTGNHLSDPFAPYTAVCLETQGYPDSPNHPHFPSVVLAPGEEYHSTTQFQFSTEESNTN